MGSLLRPVLRPLLRSPLRDPLTTGQGVRAPTLDPGLAPAINGDWATQGGWSIVGSTLVGTAVEAAAISYTTVTLALTAGAIYRVTVRVSAAAGSALIRLTPDFAAWQDVTEISTAGEHVIEVAAAASSPYLVVQAGAGGFTGSITAISIVPTVVAPAPAWISRRNLGVWLDAEPLEGADALSVYETSVGASPHVIGHNMNDTSTTAFSSQISYAISKTVAIEQPIMWAIPLATGDGSGSTNNCSLAQAASGTLDAIWTAHANAIKTSRPGKGDGIRPGWEMNGDWFPWYSTGKEADYISAFRRCVGIYRAILGADVPVSWCPSFDATTADPTPSYPGDDWVTMIGLDFYMDTGWGTDASGFWSYAQSGAAWTLSAFSAFAASRGKRIAIDEWGVTPDANAAVVTNFAAWMHARDVQYHAWWQETEAYSSRLDLYPAIAAAYVAAFGPPVIATGDQSVPTAGGTIGLSANQTVTWSLSGPNAGLFSVAGSTLTCPAGTEGSDLSVDIVATNIYGYATTKTVVITSHDAVPIAGSFLGALTPKTAAASTFTWSGEAFGDADAARSIVVTLNYRAAGTPSLTGVTIGGVPATIGRHQVNTSDGNTSGTIIACAAAPSGATGDIVVNFSGNVARIGGGKVRALNLGSATPTATAGANTGSDGDPTLSIDIYAGGLLVASEYYTKSSAVAEQRSSGASKFTDTSVAGATVVITNTGADAAWSGTAGIVEDYDQQLTTGSSAPQAAAAASWAPV